MSGNTFGSIFKVTTFGESHGEGLGCVIDGCPSGISINIEDIQKELDRRRPGVSLNNDTKLNPSVTSRKEDDKVEILSGIFNGKTEGTPIALLIRNTSQHSSDYDNLVNTMRPGHADYTYSEKYGNSNRDYRGGGRSSGRETCARVAAGAIAKAFLKEKKIDVKAYTIKVGNIKANQRDFLEIENNALRCCDKDAALKMQQYIEETRKNKDSVGGIVECTVKGVPVGLGEPVFDKLDAEIGKAILSIGAIKGIEFGDGFDASESFGSYNNDAMKCENGKVIFETNHSGGILGGISNGNDIVFRASIKPVPSIFTEQNTIKINENKDYENTVLQIKGRHDVCLCPRIVPVIEAMTNIVLADMFLRNEAK